MAPRRSGVHSLLNSTETAPGYGLGPDAGTSPPGSSDSYVSSPRSRSGSSLSPTSPRRLRSPATSRVEALTEAGSDVSPFPGGRPRTSYGQAPPSGTPHYPSTAQNHATHLSAASSYHPGGSPSAGFTAGAQLSQPPNSPPAMPPLAQTVGDRLPVSIDTYSASREAGGRRQKNADASARYRRRKADQAAEEKSRISLLEEEVRYLGGRVIQLSKQTDFYRKDRQKLREIMMEVPELRTAAMERPESPRPPVDME